MEQREKLIWMLSLLMDPQNAFVPTTAADHLLANGVVVLPCRCEECEYKAIGFYDDLWCKLHDTGIAINGFCSYGKRKGGDE